MNPIVIIPARLSSTRLPNKPLLRFDGKSMLKHTLDKVLESDIARVIVATDSQHIAKEVEDINDVTAVMTSPDHSCGTDRVLEAFEMLRNREEYNLIINVQGDEPFIDPQLLKDLVSELPKRMHADFWTTVTPNFPIIEQDDENVAKVVLNQKQDALIFTRKRIDNAYKHTSVYVYKPSFLKKFCKLAPSPLEKSYRLEQMRALDNGLTLNCIPLDYDAISINTKEDLEKANIDEYQLFEA